MGFQQNYSAKPYRLQVVYDQLHRRTPVPGLVNRGQRVLQERRLDARKSRMADRAGLRSRVQPALFERRELHRSPEVSVSDRL